MSALPCQLGVNYSCVPDQFDFDPGNSNTFSAINCKNFVSYLLMSNSKGFLPLESGVTLLCSLYLTLHN